LQSLSILIITE